MLNKNYKERPSANEILNSEWLQNSLSMGQSVMISTDKNSTNEIGR